MNLLHLRASNFYGGPERQIHFHARRLRDEHHQVTLASFKEAEGTPEFLERIGADGLPIHVFDVSSAYDTTAIVQIRTYLNEHEIDIFCTHDYRSHVLGWLAHRKTRARWIAFSRGWTTENLKVRIFGVIDRGVIRFADHLVAVSEAQKRRMQRAFISGSRISVAYNAIDPVAFDEVPAIDLRERYGFPADSMVAISGGRFSSEKGQLDLLKAARIAMARDERLRLVMFGDGPDRAAIEAQRATGPYADRIVCPGHDQALIGCIKGADMLVNPSLSEGLPNIVLEGMALGAPVVVTAVGGVPELVTHDSDGLLVPSKHPRALADAMVRVAGDPSLRSRLTETARHTVNSRFSFASQYEALMQVYKIVMSD